MKKIKITDEQLRKLLIVGEVIIGDIKLDATRKLQFPKEIFELVQTKIQIDENIRHYFDNALR